MGRRAKSRMATVPVWPQASATYLVPPKVSDGWSVSFLAGDLLSLSRSRNPRRTFAPEGVSAIASLETCLPVKLLIKGLPDWRCYDFHVRCQLSSRSCLGQHLFNDFRRRGPFLSKNNVIKNGTKRSLGIRTSEKWTLVNPIAIGPNNPMLHTLHVMR
jgi:hypothetical protein